MGTFIKKDLLVFWRDRKEILLALLLPVIIIVVLNTSFSGFFKEDKEMTKIEVAVVQMDDEADGLKMLEEKFNSPVNEQMIEQAAPLLPLQFFKQFLDGEDLKKWVTTKEMTFEEAKDQLNQGQLDAIIIIPEQFTFHVLSSVILDDRMTASISIYAKKKSSEVTTLQYILNEFVNTLNVQYALGRETNHSGVEPLLPKGGKEVVEGMDTYTFSQYFTIAIATLFGLFMAQTVALKTITEKREQVFNRILLTNSNPIYFLVGKSVATSILAWLQLMITLTIIQVLLNVFPNKSLTFWLGMILIFTIYSFFLGSLAALFTSITLYLSDSNQVSGLTTLIIVSMGVVGRSFFPLEGLPEIIKKVGDWTPNGITQTAIIEYIQFSQLSNIVFPITILIAMFAICFTASILMFPKRGHV